MKECVRRMSDSIDKRFCFDVISADKASTVYTFQALSDEDRKLWLEAMDGQDPVHVPGVASLSHDSSSKGEECALDDFGFSFVRKCIDFIEDRGLEDQGLYRVVGVASRVNKLIQSALIKHKSTNADATGNRDFSTEDWEIRTVTSALKQFFRNLPEPLMTFRLHQAFIHAASKSQAFLSSLASCSALSLSHLLMANCFSLPLSL